MTRESAIKYLPLVKALAEGKQIQSRCNGGEWEDNNVPAFFDDTEYRLKPEDKFIWVLFNRVDKPIEVYDHEDIIRLKPDDKMIGRLACFKEVPQTAK